MTRYEEMMDEECTTDRPCMHCRDRQASESERDARGVPDERRDALTMAIVAALDAPKRSRVEKAEALANVIMEAMRRERTHHDAEHHGYTD